MAEVQLRKVRYTHDAVIDEILINPTISQNDLAKMFGFSVSWISICMNSDAFKERLAERKAEITDPILRATIKDKVEAAAGRALDRIIDRLESPTHGSIKTADLVAIAKLGATPPAPAPAAQTNNLYVVQVPAPANNAQSWLSQASGRKLPGGIPLVEEIEPRVNP